MPSDFDLGDRVAVITGAGSGIGRAMAEALARRSCHLALVDVDSAGLEETAAGLTGIRTSRHLLDVADADAIKALPDAVRTAHGGAALLINNAGVALSGSFEQVSEQEFDWLMAINFGGVVRMTRAFLPLLRAEPEARLVNLSSLFGLIAPPGQTAYAASKFAVRGFSESLRQELRRTTVGVTVVHPGGIATNIARHARIGVGVPPADVERQAKMFERALRMPPAQAGEIIVRGIERRRPRVIVGNDAKFASVVERFLPTGYWPVLERLSTAKRARK